LEFYVNPSFQSTLLFHPFFLIQLPFNFLVELRLKYYLRGYSFFGLGAFGSKPLESLDVFLETLAA
jgi:hypothetical protein